MRSLAIPPGRRAGIRSASAGIGLEGAIERADRLEAGVHGDGQHRDVALAQVGKCGLGLVDPVAIEKRIEVAVAEALVDDLRSRCSGRSSLAASMAMVRPSCR